MHLSKKLFNLLMILFLFASINGFSQFVRQAIDLQIVQTQNCVAPTDLTLEIETTAYDKYRLNFSWEMNEPEPGWVHWDDGVNYTGIGLLSDQCEVSAAARWDSGQLMEYDGFKISKIKAFLNDSTYAYATFKVWTGENAETNIYSVMHDTVCFHDWLEHELETDIYLDADLEYWIGDLVFWINQ